MSPQPQNLLRKVQELTEGGVKIHAIELKPGNRSVLILRDDEKVARNEAHRKKMLDSKIQLKENIDSTLLDEFQQKFRPTSKPYSSDSEL